MNRNQMRRLANRSTHKLYCHSALIYSGSRLLAVGYNHEYMHAEVHAIKRLRALYREDIGNSRRPTAINTINAGHYWHQFTCGPVARLAIAHSGYFTAATDRYYV